MQSTHSKITTERTMNSEVYKLNEYFNDQLTLNLNSLKTLLAFDSPNMISLEVFNEILHLIEEIHDLAMVHGYESIEAIADKISQAAADLRSVEQHEARSKIESGLAAIRDIVTLTKGTKESPWNAEFSVINNFSFDESRNFSVEKLPRVKNTDQTQKDEGIFDIKEMDSLALVAELRKDEMNTINSEITGATVIEEPLSENNLNWVLNENFREEALENLELIQEALQKIHHPKTLKDATLKLKTAFGALNDLVRSYNVLPLIEPLALINKICDEEIVFNLKPAKEILELLSRSEMVVREFFEERTESETSLAVFSENLHDLINSENEKKNSLENKKNSASEFTKSAADPNEETDESNADEDPKELIRKRWLLQNN